MGLEADTLFIGLTRPQMFAGVSYTVVVANVIAATELFLLFKSPLVIAAALAAHVAALLVSRSEPRFFDLWITRAFRCPRVANYEIWRCNSYRP